MAESVLPAVAQVIRPCSKTRIILIHVIEKDARRKYTVTVILTDATQGAEYTWIK